MLVHGVDVAGSRFFTRPVVREAAEFAAHAHRSVAVRCLQLLRLPQRPANTCRARLLALLHLVLLCCGNSAVAALACC